ncbi:MAG: hypothetical protein AAF790_09140 [Planctomycetota bacterium]
MADTHDPNPYASPQATEPAVPETFEPWRDGDLICTPSESTLPPRCYVCNTDALFLYPAEIGAVGWFSLRGVAIRISVTTYCCSLHRVRQRLRGLITVALALTMLALVAAASHAVEQIGLPWPLALLPLVAAGAAAVYANARLERWSGRQLTIAKARNRMVWLKGAGDAYLASLDLSSTATQTPGP